MSVGRIVKKRRRRALNAGRFGGKQHSARRPAFVPKTAPCVAACPSGNDVRTFVTTVARAGGPTEEAWRVYVETNPFPAICGRVCPAPCEAECNRRDLDGAVGINAIERAVGDFGLEKGLALRLLEGGPKRERIVVAGAGPAGLSCAYQLARRGYPVTVFEAAERPGGMLRRGIPRYRLPARVVDAEIRRILDLGVDLRCGVRVGIEDLKQGYDAVFVAVGAQRGTTLGVEGEASPNVFSGIDFLDRFNRGDAPALGDGAAVLVVGGGDTAMDAARVCRRLGARVTVVYRRTIAEMPAIASEVEAAGLEGVRFEFLAAPAGFVLAGGRVAALKCVRVEPGEPDESGRRRPVPVAGSEFEIPATAVIPAVGQEPDAAGFESWVPEPGRVEAGGDFRKLGLVTEAVGDGRRVAEAIDRRFRGAPEEKVDRPTIRSDRMRLDHFERRERRRAVAAPVGERLADAEREVNPGLGPEEAAEESRRCMSCGACFDCEKCWMFCQDRAVARPKQKGAPYVFMLENCTGCDKCAQECPCGLIETA